MRLLVSSSGYKILIMSSATSSPLSVSEIKRFEGSPLVRLSLTRPRFNRELTQLKTVCLHRIALLERSVILNSSFSYSTRSSLWKEISEKRVNEVTAGAVSLNNDSPLKESIPYIFWPIVAIVKYPFPHLPLDPWRIQGLDDNSYSGCIKMDLF